MVNLDLRGLSLLNIDVFKRHFSKCSRIEIFFDKWFKTNDRDPKFSLFQPFRFYLIGKLFKTCIEEHLIRLRWPLLPNFLPNYVHLLN